MLQEFKSYVFRGNVVDMAVGVIIGGAFGKIVSSFVSDILTPILSLGLGKVDFSNLFIALDGSTYKTLEEAKKAGIATVNLGLFMNYVIDFTIIAFSIFMLVKFLSKVQKTEAAPPAPETTKVCPECISTIPIQAKRCAHCTSAV